MIPHPFERYAPLVDDWPALLDALGRPLPTCIWTNPLRTGPDDLNAWFERESIPLERLAWLPGAFRLLDEVSAGTLLPFRTGHYHVQEEVSLLPVHLLDPQPGERVLDLCAAPGGKTAQIALAMRNTGTVIANDRSSGRLNILRRLLARLGVADVTTTCHDAARFPGADGAYDRILLDAPCSCEGTSRKNPGVAEQSGREQACRMGGIQKAMLRRAVRLCRPGGRIVYSTCTYAPEENEAVLDAVLREHEGGLRLVPCSVPHLRHSRGVTRWEGRDYLPVLEAAVRIWPHQNDTGGFFVAVLEKAPGETEAIPDAVPPPESGPMPPYLDELVRYFGLPAATFSGFRLIQPSPKYLNIVSNDHATPASVAAESTGLTFLRLKTTYPKLTTAGAMAFGREATRNVVTLDRARAEVFLNKQTVDVAEAETTACAASGYVIVRHEGFVLGMGLYRRGVGGGVLESLVPGAWVGG